MGWNGNRTEARVVVLDRLFQPLEGAVRLAPKRKHVGDVERPIVLLVLLDQFGERGIGLGLVTECVVGHRQPDEAELLDRFLLDFRKRRLGITLLQQHFANCCMRADDIPGSRLSAVRNCAMRLVEAPGVADTRSQLMRGHWRSAGRGDQVLAECDGLIQSAESAGQSHGRRR